MKPNNRAGSHNLSTLTTMLSERDTHLLRLVRQHKFITTRQLQRLLFHTHTTIEAGTRACTRVLSRLRERRFLYRIDRQVGGIRGGSGAYVWALDAAGDRVTRNLDAQDKRARPFEPTSLFLAHTLAIAETRVILEESARLDALELVEVTTEPSNWRPYVGRGGEPVLLKPDLHAVTASADFEDHWFFEIDQGTESLPTLLRKCLAYVRYRDSGQEQVRSGVFPLVVWIVTDGHRRARLAQGIAMDNRLDSRLFQIISPDALSSAISPTAHTNEPLTRKEDL